ncbi:protein kinase [Asticcacaulis sp. ZE23SCel15]|uniref:bifunctional protein-serine/threonine kinase/phosphatase n=1 Tax=Asticcacaulis sp. ZE23SCel15 TaxID=3059027 RepID=UPI002660579D|nr:bifunctional protein-serine/threonine kinase/phosphatase [Asticcacaulis sp. ZE23SCel15]WKL58685.1 protein kinase [Asticcacaulis sp. ZE23SCel15]
MAVATTRLKAAIGYSSHIGRRSDNQDFAAACLADARSHHGLVAAVADGVGSRKGGRVAAELAVRSFIDDYLSQSEALSPQKTAGRALESINHWIHLQGIKDENLKGMACVFTGIVIKGRRLHSFHIGDTRLYRLREGAMGLLTRDHKPDGAEASNFITRAIGFDEAVRIDYRVHDVMPHDRLLLCSDGVHGKLNDTQIGNILAQRLSPDETAKKLIDLAMELGGDDNTTALIIDIFELPPATVKDLDAFISRLPMRDPPEVGEEIDGFKLEAMLSDGIYSRVFRARDLNEPRTVILKFPKPHNLQADTSARQAFVRETWVASRVQHIWIGSVLLLPPKRQTCLYVAQPYYEGETLEKRLSRKPAVSLTEGLDIAIKLAKALGSLHRAGVIHRDVKPDNIILLRDGGLKLLDLGFARLPLLDQPIGIIPPGTANYMSPEMFDGEWGNEQSDIFALGVTIYRMFSGGAFPYGESEPFTKPNLTRPDSLLKKRKDLPAWLESLIVQALAPDATERFQDGFEMAFKLESGAYAAAPTSLKQRYFERFPQRFWQLTTLILFIVLLLVLGSGLQITPELMRGLLDRLG